ILLTAIELSPLERERTRKQSWWQALRSSLTPWPIPEVRQVAQGGSASSSLSIRQVDERPRIFIQDATAVLKGCESEPLGPGEIFGEVAAMTRSSSNYTVVA
ncbi:MAG: hypothetical protein ACK53L_01350, partial [Pirellulaceae bacterium]